MCWHLEPAVDLPDEVKDDQEWTGQIGLEEDGGIEVGSTDWVERNVKLSNQAQQADDRANVRAVDTKGCLVGQFCDGMTVERPARDMLVKALIRRKNEAYQA
jgi:hypothetical protein